MQTQRHNLSDRTVCSRPEDLLMLCAASAFEDWKRLRRAGVQVTGNGAIKVWPRPYSKRVCQMRRWEAEETTKWLVNEFPRFANTYTEIDPEAALSRNGLPVRAEAVA